MGKTFKKLTIQLQNVKNKQKRIKELIYYDDLHKNYLQENVQVL